MSSNKNLNYFEVLGLTQNATLEEISNAYIKCIKEAKHDKSKDIYLINEAYEILKNPLKRYHYICELKANEQITIHENAVIVDNLDEILDIDSCNSSTVDILHDDTGKKYIKSKCIKKIDPIKLTHSVNDLIKERDNDINQLKEKNQFSTKVEPISDVFKPANDDSVEDINKPLIGNGLFTKLDDIDDIEENTETTVMKKKLDKIDILMKDAIEHHNINEYMRLREEQRKIITDY